MGDGRNPGIIPVGVERLLLAATEEPQIRELPYNDPAAAAEQLGVPLTPVESALLKNVSDVQLRDMVDGIRLPNQKRRRFLQAVATASAVAAVGCDEAGVDPNEAGVDPNEAGVDPDAVPSMFDAGGNRPDVDAGLDASPPDDGASDDGALDDGALDDGALDDGALNDGALDDGALDDGALDDGALDSSVDGTADASGLDDAG